MSADWEVQKALYDKLKADSTFMALISNNIFDEAPTNEDYPYVLFSDAIENTDNTLLFNGYEVFQTIKIYTKPYGLGSYTGKQILSRMNVVLNMKKFSMDTYNMIICKYDGSRTIKMKDKRVITVRYQVLAEDNTQINLSS